MLEAIFKTKKKQRKAVMEDMSIWMIAGLLVLVIGIAIAIVLIKKGLINIDEIKNLFRFGIG